MASLQLRPTAALLSLLTFFAAKSASAATYYVSPSGSAGSAEPSKGSPTSVGSALGKVVGGDVVVFLDGTYTSTVYLVGNRESSGSPITLRADENAVPIIRGTGSRSASGLARDRQRLELRDRGTLARELGRRHRARLGQHRLEHHHPPLRHRTRTLETGSRPTAPRTSPSSTTSRAATVGGRTPGPATSTSGASRARPTWSAATSRFTASTRRAATATATATSSTSRSIKVRRCSRTTSAS